MPSVFNQISLNGVVLNVPFGTKNAYAAAEVWKDFGQIIELGNANLSALSVSGYTISPAFSANTTNYTLTVPNATSSITISATAADSKAKSVIGTGAKELIVGSNTFEVVVTAEDGTTQTYTITITRAPEEPTGVDDVETHGRASLHAYPNPTSGELRIKNHELRAGDAIEVFTAAGQRVAIFTATGEETVIDLSHLSAGVYVVRVGEWTAKVVKQ